MGNQIEIFKSDDNQIELKVQFDIDTVWLTQAQMAELFERNRVAVTQHIGNIFKEGELEENLVCKDFLQTTPHGIIKSKTQSRTVKFYNLDVIISVGYRVKSKRGTQFRQWATQRLKDYLVQGYAVPLLMATSALPPRVSCFSCNETTVCALPERAWPSAMKRWPV